MLRSDGADLGPPALVTVMEPKMVIAPHNQHSSHRESLLEHLFLGELLRHLWLRGCYDVEVTKPQVDAAGWDVSIQVRSVTRHIQLKASFLNMKNRTVSINERLSHKPSGCVVWMCFDKNTLELGPFHLFGAGPGRRLPSLAEFPPAKNTRANAKGVKKDRQSTRKVAKTHFTRIETVDELVVRLFGAKNLS